MRRTWLRLVMALVGIGVFFVYALGAVGGYLLLSWLVAEPPNLAVAAVVLVAFTVLAGYTSYRFGTERLLSSLEAVELPRSRAPTLYRRLGRLAAEMDVTQPPVLVGNAGAPNALSLGGPRSGVVVIDRRLLSLLTINELEGILAHELAHMERYDTFVQTLAFSLLRTLVGLVTLLFLPLLLLLAGLDRGLAWVRGQPVGGRTGVTARAQLAIHLLVGALLSGVTLLLLAHSRRREFAADRRAAEVTGNPIALARALSKIHNAANPSRGLRSLLYIHDDRRERDGPGRFLSTHPPVEHRIERLVGMSGTSVKRHQLGRLRP